MVDYRKQRGNSLHSQILAYVSLFHHGQMSFHDTDIESISHSSFLDTRASLDVYIHSREDVFQIHDSSEEAVASR